MRIRLCAARHQKLPPIAASYSARGRNSEGSGDDTVAAAISDRQTAPLRPATPSRRVESTIRSRRPCDCLWSATSRMPWRMAEIDRVMAAKVRSGCVFADAGYRIRAQRAVSTRANGTRTGLGRWHSSSPQGVSGQCAAHLAGDQSSGASTEAPRAGYIIDRGRTHVGRRQVDDRELAQWDERWAESPVCCCALAAAVKARASETARNIWPLATMVNDLLEIEQGCVLGSRRIALEEVG